MGIFRQFPYTNFHEINLDWLLNNMRRLMSEWEQFVVDWGKEVSEEVAKWLEEHPEVTTTVQDHSISEIKLTDELAAKTIKDYYTPQMFGAKGDGVTDDTEAFRACQDLEYVIIPKGDYVINSEVKLNHVLEDYGNYSNYEPLYRKDIEISIHSAGYGIQYELPILTSYAESCTFVNNCYYIVCRNYDNNVAYIAIYDENLEYLRHVNLPAVYGNANSINHDDNYLYVDFDTGYHIRLEFDLTGIFEIYYPQYRAIVPYNNYFYGVQFRDYPNDDIVISKMAGYGGNVIESNIVRIKYSTPQGVSVINGVLYMPCVETNIFDPWDIRFVDIATMDIYTVAFNSMSEIESFFDKNGELRVIGNYYGVSNGTFRIGELNGIAQLPIEYLPVDCSIGAVQLIGTSGARNGAYRIINGTNGGFPENVGDYISLTDLKLFVTNTGKIYSYRNNTWNFIGYNDKASAALAITIGGQSFNGSVHRHGSSGFININGGSGNPFSAFASGETIGTLPAEFRPYGNIAITALARTVGGWATAELIPISISLNASTGAISVNGNTEQIKTCRYVTIVGEYPLT